nr:TonB-dependent receptor [Opitutaceae bacterium]
FTAVTTFQPGLMGLNLRGYGLVSALPLVNGRRISYFGQGGAASLAYDIGSLPVAALESVEILKDGASAIYGSDAVAGAVNFKLINQFEGTRVRAGYADIEGGDLGERSFGILHGFIRERGSLVVAAELSGNNGVLASDRPLSRSEDKRPLGGFNFSSPFTFPATVTLPAGTPGMPAALTGRPIAPGVVNPDGTVSLRPAAGTPAIADFVPLPPPVTGGLPTPGDTINGLDRAPYTTLVPPIEDTALYLSGEWQPFTTTEGTRLFTELSYRRREMATTYEPGPVNLSGERGFGDGPGGQLVLPATNPFNPFGIDVLSANFFLPEVGPYRNTIIPETLRLVGGVRGEIGADWTWETALTHNRSRVFSRWDNYLSDTTVQDALAGRTPTGEFLNPFGANSPAVLDTLRVKQVDHQVSENLFGDVRASGPLGSWAGGEIGLAVGAEHRWEHFQHRPDTLRRNGGLINLARREPRAYDREVSGAFTELGLPVGPRLETQLAVRGENYSDFGATAKPKVAAKFKLTPWAFVRASYAEAYRPPDLLQLNATNSQTLGQVADPRRPDLGIYTVRIIQGGNRDLTPENTQSKLFGFVVEPPVVPGLRASIDFWHFDQTDAIATIGAANQLLFEQANGGSSAVTRGPSPGPGIPGEIVEIQDTFGNFNARRTSGYDIETRYVRPSSIGTWTTSLSGTWTQMSESADFRSIYGGKPGGFATPDYRLFGQVGWSHRGWAATWSTTYLPPVLAPTPPGWTGGDYYMDAAVRHNLFLGLPGPWGSRITLGVENVFDTEPELNYGDRFGYTSFGTTNLGRLWRIGWEHTF